MPFRTFFGFVAPSVVAMLALIAVPLIGVVYLALHNSYVKTEIVEVTTSVPLIGGLTREETKSVPQPVVDADGNPIKVWQYVGAQNLTNVADPDGLVAALEADRSTLADGRPASVADRIRGLYQDIADIDFWGALEFTLIYTFITTPFVLVLGFLIALAVHHAVKWLKGILIFASLLPFIITPVVGSLSIYWLFLDNAVVAAVLEQLGFGKVYFLQSKLTIRSLIILYGVWHVTPFAFIVLYAGLQTLPEEALEAAIIDGATRLQQIWYVVIPHLMPLFVFITLIHLMDAYRVFEPVLVFGSNVFANSLQYWTYYIINFEDNFHKAAASAILTVGGITILLIPVLVRTWREHRTG